MHVVHLHAPPGYMPFKLPPGQVVLVCLHLLQESRAAGNCCALLGLVTLTNNPLLFL